MLEATQVQQQNGRGFWLPGETGYVCMTGSNDVVRTVILENDLVRWPYSKFILKNWSVDTLLHPILGVKQRVSCAAATVSGSWVYLGEKSEKMNKIW